MERVVCAVGVAEETGMQCNLGAVTLIMRDAGLMGGDLDDQVKVWRERACEGCDAGVMCGASCGWGVGVCVWEEEY